MILCFDITPEKLDFSQNLWCLILYTIGIMLTLKYNTSPLDIWNKPNHSNTLIIVFTVFIMSLTCFANTDYYSYWEILNFENLNIEEDEFSGSLEPIYYKIGELAQDNYIIFRTIIWGSALFGVCLSAKLLNLSIGHTIFILGAAFMIIFCYGRVSLAMSIVFTGYIIFYANKSKNIIFSIIGILLFLWGYNFHTSIFLAMAMIIIMPFIKFSKSWVIIYIILIPVFFLACKWYYQYLLLTGGDLNEVAAGKLSSYSEVESEGGNIGGLLESIFGYGRFYLPVILAVRELYVRGRHKDVPIICNNLVKISVGIIFISTCFFFFGLDSQILAYRILYMSMIPICLFMTFLYKYQIWTRKEFVFCISIGMIVTFEQFLYAVYKLS